MSVIPSLTGKCLCGAVTFTATNIKPELGVCHCSMCRQWSGGPFFGIDVETVAFEGEEHITRFASSDWAERGSCAKCGTNLFYYLKPMPTYVMCAGVFDDQSRFCLAEEIFIDNKPAGFDFAGDHPRLTEAETLAKFQALMEQG